MEMRCKILITILLLIVISTENYSQGIWERIDSPTDQFLKSTHFVDSLYGFFLNRNLGWAVAWKSDAPPYGTIILTTTNGGGIWQNSAYRDENIFMNCVLFLDSLTGWMGGSPHTLVKTTDGGGNWEQADVDSTNLSFFPVLNISFYNEQYGFACGGLFDAAGVIWKTTNGGDRWTPIDPLYAPPDEIWQMHFFDSLNVIGVGGDPDQFGAGFINTTDAGISWDYNEIGILGAVKAVSFRTGSEGWAPIPQASSMVYTLDSAKTWTEINVPDSAALYDLIFPDSLHGFAVGVEGAILKYKPLIVDDVKVISQTTPSSYQLYQNYPNPFNPTTKIKFSIPSNQTGDISNVKVVVYDIIGNEVTSLLDKELLPGSYEVTFRSRQGNRQLVSGVYFYQMITRGFLQTKKMILMK
jgi:photosystem II stability/assembly factor-like uncharacterized protein